MATRVGAVPKIRSRELGAAVPLTDWDRRLHFGHDPWTLLQPLLGQPAITSLLSMAYASWFFVLYGVMFWQAFSRGDRVLLRKGGGGLEFFGFKDGGRVVHG